MNEVRIAKFMILIDDINNCLDCKMNSLLFFSDNRAGDALRLIFIYDECNEYAKSIIKNAKLKLVFDKINDSSSWRFHCAGFTTNEYNMPDKIDGSQEFIKPCREKRNKNEGYKFIFWSLMVLTVDKNKADEYLSLICDFTKMLRITEDEFEDIIHVIKVIYNESDKDYSFKSETIPSVFSDVLNMYRS